MLFRSRTTLTTATPEISCSRVKMRENTRQKATCAMHRNLGEVNSSRWRLVTKLVSVKGKKRIALSENLSSHCCRACAGGNIFELISVWFLWQPGPAAKAAHVNHSLPSTLSCQGGVLHACACTAEWTANLHEWSSSRSATFASSVRNYSQRQCLWQGNHFDLKRTNCSASA